MSSPNSSPTTLFVDVGDPGFRRVSPTLWGIFLEDLNGALDGGLDADLVQNGHFEYTSQDKPGWGPLTAWRTEGAVSVRNENPVHPHNAVHLRLGSDDGRGAAVNDGYGGMFLPAGIYVLRCAVRAARPASLDVELLEGDRVATSTRMEVTEAEWEFLEYRLELEKDIRGGALRLGTARGSVDLDVVSLRPLNLATGMPRIFREDLLHALKDLRPRFVRFPGGCVAHGLGLDNMYHWKQTVGPRHERQQMRNLWGYHQSMSIGYLEYFQLCEELGALPVPIVAAGVCCQNYPGGAQAIPEEEMPKYIQDVLDLVEFATGGVETAWGRLRAEWGHPEPFALRHIGVGNEDEITEDFTVRFAAINRELSRRHPEITVIGTSGPQLFGPDFEKGWDLARRENVPMVDEHGYRTPHWWLQNIDRYDGYDRSGPGVYLGEYAARTSRLRSALAEAAFMVGMERNGDVVQMASYAPLLAREGSMAWEPDLIYFTGEEVMLSASYHVQRMMGAATAEAVCPVTVRGATLSVKSAPPSRRNVRLSSRGSDVRWSGLRIDGRPAPDQSTERDGHEMEVATWSSTSFDFRAQVLREQGEEGVILRFGGDGNETFHEIVIGSWQNRSTLVGRSDDGITNELDGPFPFVGVATGRVLDLRVAVSRTEKGLHIRVWVDSVLRHDLVDEDAPAQLLVAGAVSTPDGGREIRLVNYSGEAHRSRISTGIDGRIAARSELLHGDDPDSGAPFEHWPLPDITKEQTSTNGDVDIDVPPWSFLTISVTAIPAR